MTDKQRLDAYVQAAMAGFYANPLITTETHQPEQLMKFIFEGAKDMMDFVDAQEAKDETEEDTEGWILNTGLQPANDSIRVQVKFKNGEEDEDSIKHYDWKLDGFGYDITHWRKAQ